VQPRPILVYSPSSDPTEYCLDPGSGRPAAGAQVKLQRCDADDHQDNGYKQNWYYRENLTLSPVASLLVNKANAAMCLDAGASPGIGVFPTMQVCVEPAPARQRWYHNSAMNFELAAGSAADGWSLSGLCLNAAKPDTAGADVVLGGASNCHGAYDTRQTFGLFTKVGPGEAGRRATDCTAAAGYPCAATQLLTHAMPARCADRYGGQMVMFDCAQAPDPAGLPWNQVWRVANPPDGPAGAPEKPIVTIDPGGAAYCLTSSSSGALSQRECDPQAPAADQKFDQYRNTGDAFTMYRIVDSRGRCLTHANGQDTGDGTSLLFRWNPRHYNWRLIVRACINSYSDPDAGDDFNRASGLSRQKWNAPFVLPTKLPPATAAPTPPGAEPTTQAPTPSPVPTPTAAVPTAAASPLAAAVAALSLRNLVEIPPPD
jgi:hypothetical protein